MKKIILAVFLMTAIAVANSFAADCRVLEIKEVPGSVSGVTAEYELLLSMAGLKSGVPFFQGQSYLDGPWKSWPIVDNGNGTATATISGWRSGDPMEFSYGRGPYWTDPSCSSFEYEGHLRAVLGKKRIPNIDPIIAFLLLKKKTPVQNKVISIKEIAVNGPLGTYSITVGLNSLPSGTPFFQGQSYSGGPWKSWPIVDNGNGTATATISGWSRGTFLEFSFGVSVNNNETWVDPSGSPYLYAGHFGATLGQSQICSINDENDPLVKRITDLGGGIYRMYLGFPIEEGFSSLFVRGQVAPNDTWISWPVKGTYPCYYIDLNWPYSGTFHFSFGIIKRDGTTERWVDPTLSKFQCLDHLCITPTLY